MIGEVGSALLGGLPSLVPRVAAARLLRWPVACAPAACFYVKPIPPVDVNEPPVVIEPDDEPRRVPIAGDTVVLTVIAYDPEGGPVEFEWPDLADVPHDLDVYWRGEVRVCRVEVLAPERLPSTVVRASVSDADRDNTVTVRFVVEAP